MESQSIKSILKTKDDTIKKIKKLAFGLRRIKLDSIFEKCTNINFEEISTVMADNSLIHPEYGILAGRILMKKLHQTTSKTFSDCTEILKDKLVREYYNFVMENKEKLNEFIIDKRDYNFDFFGVKTLEKSYLLKQNCVTAERPQYLYMRVATYIHMPDLDKIKICYNHLSLFEYSHASPTLFNSAIANSEGENRSQLASCFLMSIEDSTNSLSKSWSDVALISKNSGGIGCDYSKIRHSEIYGVDAVNKGIIPWLKIKNSIIQTVNQGGRRNGSCNIFLSDHHVDIEEFLDLKKATGDDNLRARDLFYSLWISDLFMTRVENDEMWSLFCPAKAKGLTDCWGKEFEDLYCEFEKQGLWTRQMKARDLWKHIVLMQMETGMPFILFKDSCNRKSNQQNLGTIKTSNLCVEIIEYTDEKEIASCNLGSISLNKCIKYNDELVAEFDFDKLEKLVSSMTVNLNQVIDRNYYIKTIPEIQYSNLKNRPLGIGVSGLADLFAILGISWESDKARILNSFIFETMYYSALKQSMRLAKQFGPYGSFPGSFLSQGILQFDTWESEKFPPMRISTVKWNKLKQKIQTFGVRNSLLIALMPTASTAQIIGNNESFEPFTSNLYSRKVLSGQFIVSNKYLVNELLELKIWNSETIHNLMENEGSVQQLDIPDSVKNRYKTVWELPQKILLQMSADRGRFICQSQSLNVFFEKPTYQKITSFLFTGWKLGLKTGSYYIRSKSAAEPVNFSLNTIKTEGKIETECLMCSA
jgi:ribonucleoside-diphosphate reductase alpha subunit